jgi:hypothetical protein
MLPAALTAERVRLPDGTSATRYPWNGEEVLVRDDASRSSASSRC